MFKTKTAGSTTEIDYCSLNYFYWRKSGNDIGRSVTDFTLYLFMNWEGLMGFYRSLCTQRSIVRQRRIKQFNAKTFVCSSRELFHFSKHVTLVIQQLSPILRQCPLNSHLCVPCLQQAYWDPTQVEKWE